MKISDLTEELEEKLGLRFKTKSLECNREGHKWERIRILHNNSIDIGEIVFRDDEYYSSTQKKGDKRRDLCFRDEKFFCLERYIQDGVIISKPVYNGLVEIAHEVQAQDLGQKIAYRNMNPKNNRKPLKGMNIRYVLRRIILNISKEDLDVMERSLSKEGRV